MTAAARPAAFLDRDGTIIEDLGYLSDPAQVRLLPGAADALRRLAAAGHALVVVTNQSGIGRGYYGPADFRRVQARLEALLAERGVRLDGVYHCPHHPEADGPCACRKPGTGLHRQAAAALGLDLSASSCIGDKRSDVEPAAELGGRGYLVLTGEGALHAADLPRGVEVVADLAAAADRILVTAGA